MKILSHFIIIFLVFSCQVNNQILTSIYIVESINNLSNEFSLITVKNAATKKKVKIIEETSSPRMKKLKMIKKGRILLELKKLEKDEILRMFPLFRNPIVVMSWVEGTYISKKEDYYIITSINYL